MTDLKCTRAQTCTNFITQGQKLMMHLDISQAEKKFTQERSVVSKDPTTQRQNFF